MLAAVTRSPGEMVIEDVSGPGRARAGHVIVRPEAVGICGSDFHLFSGDVAALSGTRDFYPRIQGHEVSAVVEDAGNTNAVNKGDRVAIWPLLPCGHCYPCRIDRPNVCVRFRLVGVHLDGGLAERLEVRPGWSSESATWTRIARPSSSLPRPPISAMPSRWSQPTATP